MRLFDLINNQVTISEEAYLLLPFKGIWDRDKSKSKEKALSELAYVYFMEDFKSDFSDIVKEEERSVEVVESLGSSIIIDDPLIREAREFYRKRSEEIISLLLLKDAKIVIDRMRDYFREVDFLATDKHGKLKYDIDKVSKVVERSAGILENLNKLEGMVKKELENKKDKVGSKTKATFEEGL
jgi:transcription initiation factor IIF auxiliary subunit